MRFLDHSSSAKYFVALSFLASRLWVSIFVYWGHSQHPYLSKVIGGWRGVDNWWLNPWTTFDSEHFIAIAREGYNPMRAAFFPLYPFCLRLAGDDSLRIALCGVLLSNVCFLIALYFFYLLTEQEYSSTVARTATWLLAFFPTAAYFSAVYTDAMFLLFFVLTFWNVRNERWGVATVWALLASLTRNIAPLIFVGLLLEYSEARRNRKTAPPAAIFTITAPLAGLVAVQAYIAFQVGSATQGVASQQEYFRHLQWPWTPVVRDVVNLLTLRAGAMTWLHLIATLLAFVLTAQAWQKQAKSYSLMTLGLMMMHLTLGHTIPPYTLPSARYLSTMFPFVQRFAVITQPIVATRLRLILAAATYLLICAIYSYLFGQKAFVG